MSRHAAGERLIDETLLKAHAKVVMNALGASVECLDDSAQLTKLLVGLGERHAMYAVKANMLPVIFTYSHTISVSGEKFTLRLIYVRDLLQSYSCH